MTHMETYVVRFKMCNCLSSLEAIKEPKVWDYLRRCVSPRNYLPVLPREAHTDPDCVPFLFWPSHHLLLSLTVAPSVKLISVPSFHPFLSFPSAMFCGNSYLYHTISFLSWSASSTSWSELNPSTPFLLWHFILRTYFKAWSFLPLVLDISGSSNLLFPLPRTLFYMLIFRRTGINGCVPLRRGCHSSICAIVLGIVCVVGPSWN